jgi:hypothetical protein
MMNGLMMIITMDTNLVLRFLRHIPIVKIPHNTPKKIAVGIVFVYALRMPGTMANKSHAIISSP